uniref:Major facilitator superfamily domain containing 14A n=1 Tax=Sphenodon punctatus TaxID=8508 RepID=A0A8D0HKK5_SPHPU
MTQAGKKKKRGANRSIMLAKKIIIKDGGTPQGIGSPSVYHAVIVIFLEFFAWGLLTAPTLVVLRETFPKHTFLMNGLIQGVKGLLSFLSAPLIGALSDVWGRKSFLLLTVFFTCAPIPLMKISPWLVACIKIKFVVVCFINVRSKLSYQPCYWCLPGSSIWRQLGSGSSYGDSFVGYLFYSCCCTRITARKDEASIMGSTHFLGTGRPLCGKTLKCLSMEMWLDIVRLGREWLEIFLNSFLANGERGHEIKYSWFAGYLR